MKQITLFLLWSALVGSVAIGASGREVRYQPGREITILLGYGKMTEVVFDERVVGYVHPDKDRISISKRNARLYLKPLPEFDGRIFVDDAGGNHYVLNARTVQEDEDTTVYVVAGAAVPGWSISLSRTADDVFVEVMRSMATGRDLAGFERQHYNPGVVFYKEAGGVVMRLKKSYTSATLIGQVVEISNAAKSPVRVNVQKFKMKGLIAVAVKNEFLSPAEPADSLEAYKGYPRTTTGYLLIDPTLMGAGE